jgi:hypothetical protein
VTFLSLTKNTATSGCCANQASLAQGENKNEDLTSIISSTHPSLETPTIPPSLLGFSFQKINNPFLQRKFWKLGLQNKTQLYKRN